jgi:hypothetical protein
LEFSLFSQKYSVQNWVISKVWILGNREFMIQQQNRRKYFVENGRETILDIFGYILDPSKKCPFCPLRAINFKTRNSKHPKNGFVTIMLSKHIFCLKNPD